MDYTETNLYIACDNQNIYCYGMETQPSAIESQQVKSRQKRTLQHKHKVTALCLTVDGQQLISGDQSGVIYIWSTQNIHSAEPGSPRNDSPKANTNINIGLISTFDLHKDHGPITNLVPLIRPLSLFGLTSNMKAFEPGEIMPL